MINTSNLWVGFTAGFLALVMVWGKLQALALLAPAVGFKQRICFSLAIAVVCSIVATIAAATVGLVLTAPIVWLTENGLVLVYTWFYLPAMRTRAFWQELLAVRIPRWYQSAKQLPSEFASVWFWMDQHRHIRQLMQPWRQDLKRSPAHVAAQAANSGGANARS